MKKLHIQRRPYIQGFITNNPDPKEIWHPQKHENFPSPKGAEAAANTVAKQKFTQALTSS
jgi:hypothetical protein